MKEHFLASNRRAFIQRSLAAAVVAAQPALLSGLLRASGGGGSGGGYTKPPSTTEDPYDTLPHTTDFYQWDTTCWTCTTEEPSTNPFSYF